MSVTGERGVINVQPHPRLLGVLGDIELAPWRCLAELVDNAFDAFLREAARVGRDDDSEAPTVSISLPSRSSSPRDAEVWVRDNGTGMSLTQLNAALRAGWSSNDRFGKLGLYGVGFNIATARLGHVAVVKTARVEDATWTIVTLDVRALARSDHFDLPVTTEPKVSPDEHGTTVIVRELKDEHFDSLSRQQSKIRTNLGEVYSHLLIERDFVLKVDGRAVKPRRPCLWDESRYVVRSREKIPAVIKINEVLPSRPACMDCGAWQDGTDASCESCGSERLRAEERRIWGWLGIQRYLHANDYGIDFIRNGRKILIRDDKMFHWNDPDDPSGKGIREYPIEVPPAGRIIGEIHIDHVKVNYQKDAFEYDTPEWKKVVQVLRGRGPILPKKAKEAGYVVNTSPLAKLVAGYRRTEAGLDYLIPGDGKHALHSQAREWAQLFQAGDPKYQTDEQWYLAAQSHDAPPPPPSEPSPPAENERRGILDRKGILDPEPQVEIAPPVVTPPAPETEQDRRARWREHADRLPDLEKKFGLPGQGAAMDVTAFLVRGQHLRREDDPRRVPVYVASSRGSNVEVFIDADHPVFTDFAVDTRDLVVMELAEFLRIRNNDKTIALSDMFYELKERCLADQKVSGYALNDVATRILDRIREAMRPVIAGSSTGYWDLLSIDDQDAAQHKFAAEGGTARWEEDVLTSGEWIEYVPGMALVRLVTARPEMFLDGRVFRSAYTGMPSSEARAMSAERVLDFLGDVAVLADRPVKRSSDELQRGRLSCLLLERELSATDTIEDPTP
ncbi:MAG: hypothetical protein JWP75_343 [Frondihabitans sp.]|nr:hypothetical protein [Frondihabitans sp.]